MFFYIDNLDLWFALYFTYIWFSDLLCFRKKTDIQKIYRYLRIFTDIYLGVTFVYFGWCSEITPSKLMQLVSARDMAQKTVIGKERIVYSTERDMIEQDYEAEEWDVIALWHPIRSSFYQYPLMQEPNQTKVTPKSISNHQLWWKMKKS